MSTLDPMVTLLRLPCPLIGWQTAKSSPASHNSDLSSYRGLSHSMGSASTSVPFATRSLSFSPLQLSTLSFFECVTLFVPMYSLCLSPPVISDNLNFGSSALSQIVFSHACLFTSDLSPFQLESEGGHLWTEVNLTTEDHGESGHRQLKHSRCQLTSFDTLIQRLSF